MRRRLAAVASADARAWSRAACERAGALLGGRRVVMMYYPMEGELDVRPLGEACLGRGLRVCLPRVDWAAGAIVPCEVRSMAEVVPGRHGTKEPGPGAAGVPPGEIDLVFVPGLAFDERGGRLGRGAGFYDRFLGSNAVATCGIGFELQVVAAVPREAHDAGVGALVTDERLLTGLGGP